MKILFSVLCLGLLLAAGGCGSRASHEGLSPEQRQQQLKSNTNIPVPAQQRADEQIASKERMDAMRAKDAAKAPAAP